MKIYARDDLVWWLMTNVKNEKILY